MLLALTIPEKPENQLKTQDDVEHFKSACIQTVSMYTILKSAIIKREFGSEAKPVPTIFYENVPIDDMECFIKQASEQNIVIAIFPNFYVYTEAKETLVYRLLETLPPNLRAKYENKLTLDKVKLIHFDKIKENSLNFSINQKDFEDAGFVFEAL